MSRSLQKPVVLALAGVIVAAVASRTVSLAQSPRTAADLVLKNAHIYTVDAGRTQAEGVAVSNGRIVYVGGAAGLTPFIGARTQVLDLNGRLVVPGFIDGHNHAYLRAEALFWATLSGSNVDDYKAQMRSFLDQHPNVTQVRGVGFNVNAVITAAMATGRAPKVLLDEIVGRDIPAVIITNGHHQIWANSKAIQSARITKDTPNPLGAVIDRDPATGEPTGIFREFGAQNLVIGALPKPDFTVEEFEQAIQSFQQEMAGPRGVTSVLTPVHYPTENFLKALQALDKQGKLTVRYDLALWANETRGTSQVADLVETRRKYQGKLFKIDSIKIFGTGEAGLVWKQPVLEETVAALDKERFRVYVHCTGNQAANEAILDAFAYTLKTNGKRDSRHTITHVNAGAAAVASRFKELGVRADGQGPAPKALFDAGVATTTSSDYPVTDFFPPVRLARGVRNGVPLEAMIASYTIAGAELIFAERETGSIEVGKAADIVVLDRNLFETPVDDLDKARIILTLSGGREVFRDASFK